MNSLGRETCASIAGKNCTYFTHTLCLVTFTLFAISQPFKNKFTTKILTPYQDIYHNLSMIFANIIINQNRQKDKIMVWMLMDFWIKKDMYSDITSVIKHLSTSVCSSIRRNDNTCMLS